MEEGEIQPSRYPTFCTTSTSTSTNPFASKCSKVLGLGEKKKVNIKEILQHLLGKLGVSILVLSTIGLDPVL